MSSESKDMAKCVYLEAIFDFCQYGGPRGRPSRRPSKIEKGWYDRHLSQIWCYWKNLNQNIPKVPDYMMKRQKVSFLVFTCLQLTQRIPYAAICAQFY